MQRRTALVLILLANTVLTGCATMFRKGNGLVQTVREEDRNVRLIAMNMRGATPDLRIYTGDRQLPIVAVRDNIWSTGVRNGVAQASASAAAQPGAVYTWEEQTEYGPGLFLDPGRPHTLRLVRGGQEATVTVRASVRWKWIWRDALWGPLAFGAWGVDAATGSWKEFPRLDVERAFREASTAAQGNVPPRGTP